MVTAIVVLEYVSDAGNDIRCLTYTLEGVAPIIYFSKKYLLIFEEKFASAKEMDIPALEDSLK